MYVKKISAIILICKNLCPYVCKSMCASVGLSVCLHGCSLLFWKVNVQEMSVRVISYYFTCVYVCLYECMHDIDINQQNI